MDDRIPKQMLYRLLPAIFLCLNYFSAGAQSPVFRHYGVTEGLPSSETYAALQDYKGYMWFGTDRGLVKFDGYSFKTFSSADGLTDNTVFAITEDHKNRIWYNTYSNRLGYVLRDSLFSYPGNTIVKSKARHNILKGLACDRQGYLWVWYFIDDRYFTLRFDPQGHLDSSLNSLKQGTARIYLSEKTVCGLSGGTDCKEIEFVDAYTGKLIKKIESEAPFGIFSVPGKDASVFICFSDKILKVKGDSIKTLFTCKPGVLSISVDNSNNVWLGYENTGLHVYKAADNYRSSETFLPEYSVSGICADREGGMWFTTLENGVYYLPRDYVIAYRKEDGLTAAKIKRIVNMDGNAVMVMSDYNVAIKYKDKPGITVVRQKYKTPGISDIGCDERGILYYTTLSYMSNELLLKNSVGMKSTVRVYAKEKYIWTYGNNDIGRYRKPGLDNEVTDITKNDRVPPGLMVWSRAIHGAYKDFYKRDPESYLVAHVQSDRITTLFEQHDGSLLIGTADGLYSYQSFEDISSYKPMENCHPVFRNNRISDIKRIDGEHIAVAVMGCGIMLVRNNDFMHPAQFTLSQGLPSVMCYVMLRENDSLLWVGTNKGLCRIANILDHTKRRFLNISVNNGLVSNEINDLCIIGNELWVATMNGLSVLKLFTPVIHGRRDIPVYLEAVQVNGRTINSSDNRFTHDHNNISISFTGISFIHAGRLMYKYRLKGVDTGWNITSGRSIIYSTLAPGNYVFEFAALDPDGNESRSLQQYSFVIMPPFWETWWFMLLLITAVAVAVYIFVAHRVRFVRKQARINYDLNRFREKALRSQMNPHFIYNSMNAIQNYIRKNETAYSMEILSRFSRLMRLTFNNSGAELVTLAKDLEALNLYIEMEQLRFPGRISFHLSIDKNINIDTVYVPPLLLQPFLENAILHGLSTRGENGNIWLSIEKLQNSIRVSIKDDGIGITRAMAIKANKQRFIPEDEAKESAVSVTELRIRQAWGKKVFKDAFSITELWSEPGHSLGTHILFYLPLHYD